MRPLGWQRSGTAERLFAYLRDTRGAVAIIVAILAPVLVGSFGLGAEAGYWYLTQRTLQNVADVAAYGVAERKTAGDDGAALQSLADYLAERSDLDLSDSTVTVSTPPSRGAFAGDADAIEVIVSKSQPRYFTAIYDTTPINIVARAVARLGAVGGTGCVLALNASAAGAITVTGSADIAFDGCDMVANSNATGAFTRQGNGNTASAGCIQTVGTAQAAGVALECDSPREGAQAVADPYASVPEPSAVGACKDGSIGKPNKTNSLTPVENHPSGMKSMRFCGGLDLKGTINLAPGLYIIQGGTFRINSNAEINGTDVVFYLADGVDMHFNGTATIDLTAPTSGVYKGILMFGSRSATTVGHKMNGNASTVMNGAIYTPVSELTFSGSSRTGSNNCTQIVADTITFTGNGSVSMNCAVPSGETIVIPGAPVALIE